MRLPALRRSNDAYAKVEAPPDDNSADHEEKGLDKWQQKLSAEKTVEQELPFAKGTNSPRGSIRSPRALIAERGIKKHRDNAQASAMEAFHATNPDPWALGH
ncbi:uncharacterized protein ACA1_163350 [Acanthamoeba castellanii str. Neff]|uniref:Uncharacterized protein n=1 Tax=Acanthamoeba castellanii (strain ATCC 30010 / Neff) TaxID=1257118 RepID=L8GSD2_ACACF|nr:uncharacterized protein ACA1_163350 [Acanthamoeba castellanii str. Neff]ELR15508.1 hypothetical protein ACA1_163350 [Acanthamoeba castellanii str. Neff]